MPAIVVAISMVAVCAPSLADTQNESGYKIGVVNLKLVFDQYKKKREEFSKLEAEVAEMQKKIDELSKNIEAKKARYDKERETMSEDERIELEDEINAEYMDYQTRFKAFQNDVDRREARLWERLYEDVKMALVEIGARENYHLILESGGDGPTAVLYASPTLNITQKVVEYLNSGKEASN